MAYSFIRRADPTPKTSRIKRLTGLALAKNVKIKSQDLGELKCLFSNNQCASFWEHCLQL